MTLSSDQQQLSMDQTITLYQLNLTSKGGTIIYWTPDRPTEGKVITYNNITYTSVDVKFEGMEKTTTNTLPRPTITISNADRIVGNLAIQFDDLRGCPISRIKTLRKYLDDGSSPDTTAYWPIDTFLVDRKTIHNLHEVAFELATSIELRNRKIPGRLMLQKMCTLRYREYDAETGDFDYTKATCIYTGEACYNKKDVLVTNNSQDVCGKRLSSCQARFGTNSELPFGGFPGMTNS